MESIGSGSAKRGRAAFRECCAKDQSFIRIHTRACARATLCERVHAHTKEAGLKMHRNSLVQAQNESIV